MSKSTEPPKTLANLTTGGYKVEYVNPSERPSLADYAAMFMSAGYSYRFVCRMLDGLSKSSLFEEQPNE